MPSQVTRRASGLANHSANGLGWFNRVGSTEPGQGEIPLDLDYISWELDTGAGHYREVPGDWSTWLWPEVTEEITASEIASVTAPGQILFNHYVKAEYSVGDPGNTRLHKLVDIPAYRYSTDDLQPLPPIGIRVTLRIRQHIWCQVITEGHDEPPAFAGWYYQLHELFGGAAAVELHLLGTQPAEMTTGDTIISTIPLEVVTVPPPEWIVPAPEPERYYQASIDTTIDITEHVVGRAFWWIRGLMTWPEYSHLTAWLENFKGTPPPQWSVGCLRNGSIDFHVVAGYETGSTIPPLLTCSAEYI